MSEPTTEEIREVLGRAMEDSPEPHAWSEVMDRAIDRGDLPGNRHTSLGWAAAASLIVLLIGGLAVLTGLVDDSSEDTDRSVEPPSTVDEGPPDAPTASGSTTPSVAPSTAAPEVGAVWNFGLLADVDEQSLRPLDSLTRDDVVVPTAPTTWRLWNPTASAQGDQDDPELTGSEFSVIEALPDGSTGRMIELTLTRFPVCGPESPGCSLSDTTVTINSVAWETYTETDGVRANVGGWWIDVRPVDLDLAGPMLEDPIIVEYLEGLRAGTIEDLMEVGGACFDCVSDSDVDEPDPPTVDPVFVPRDVDDNAVRPLAELEEGDVVVPGYVPEGMVFGGPARASDDEFFFGLALGEPGSTYSSVRQWPRAVQFAGGPDGVEPLEPELPTDPDHPLVEIAGITWGWNDFESARVAYVGSSVILVSVSPDVDEVRFIEGLRAASIDEFPGPIQFDTDDGLSVVDGAIERSADVVATDPGYELSAVRVGDQVCTKLRQTASPVTSTFAADCWEGTRFDGSGIVDLYGVGGPDDPDAVSLIIGTVDSPEITDARITSPTGDSVVVETGPVNEAIDGRFFLARLELDVSNGIRLDRFTIEDASP